MFQTSSHTGWARNSRCGNSRTRDHCRSQPRPRPVVLSSRVIRHAVDSSAYLLAGAAAAMSNEPKETAIESVRETVPRDSDTNTGVSWERDPDEPRCSGPIERPSIWPLALSSLGGGAVADRISDMNLLLETLSLYLSQWATGHELLMASCVARQRESFPAISSHLVRKIGLTIPQVSGRNLRSSFCQTWPRRHDTRRHGQFCPRASPHG